jgi:hypothetical protein
MGFVTRAGRVAGPEPSCARTDDRYGPPDVAGEFVDSGELVLAACVADPVHTCTVERRDGVPTVVDGPGREPREFLAGVGVVDVVDLERALEIAARMSGGVGRIELRPIDGP